MNASYCKPPLLRRLTRLLMVLLPLAVIVCCLHILTQDTQAAGSSYVQINELMAKNLSSLTGQDGQPVDWLEIHNPTDQPFSMEGVGLSDKPGAPYRWVFPEYTLAPGEHLLVYADGRNCADETGFHTDFMLSGRGGTLLLTAPGGELLDKLVYPEQHWDIPYGRLDQNADTQGFLRPPPREAPTLPPSGAGRTRPSPALVRSGFPRPPAPTMSRLRFTFPAMTRTL